MNKIVKISIFPESIREVMFLSKFNLKAKAPNLKQFDQFTLLKILLYTDKKIPPYHIKKKAFVIKYGQRS